MAEWTKDDVIELLVGIIAGGRGGGGLPPGPDLATQMITGSGGRPPRRNRGSRRTSRVRIPSVREKALPTRESSEDNSRNSREPILALQ